MIHIIDCLSRPWACIFDLILDDGPVDSSANEDKRSHSPCRSSICIYYSLFHGTASHWVEYLLPINPPVSNLEETVISYYYMIHRWKDQKWKENSFSYLQVVTLNSNPMIRRSERLIHYFHHDGPITQSFHCYIPLIEKNSLLSVDNLSKIPDQPRFDNCFSFHS